MSSKRRFSAFAANLRQFIDRVDQGLGMVAMKDEFNRLALELFDLQFAHNRPYRQFCTARGIAPDRIRHWLEIPAVPASAFKELELTCLPPEERTTVFHSSGTTEQKPSRHFHSAESLAIYEASLLPWFSAHLFADRPDCLIDAKRKGGPDRGGVLILTPPPDQAPHSSLVHMFETIRRRFGWPETSFQGQVIGRGEWAIRIEGAIQLLANAVKAAQPITILGTAFSFVHLFDAFHEGNLRLALPVGSRALETGGYKGRSRTLPKTELHGLIAKRLGIPPPRIISEYGMSELSSQAYDSSIGGGSALEHNPGTSGGRRRFRFPPWVRSRIVSPETWQGVRENETGLLQVFDLANVYSVMAIQTEDLGIRRGDDFELVGRAALAETRGCSLMSA